MDNSNYNNFTNQDYKGLSEWLNTLNPYEFTIVGIITAFLIAPVLNANQQNSVGNFFEVIGQVLLVIAAQEITVQQATQNNTASTGFSDAPNTSPGNNTNNQTNNQNDNLYQEIAELKQEIAELKKLINQNIL